MEICGLWEKIVVYAEIRNTIWLSQTASSLCVKEKTEMPDHQPPSYLRNILKLRLPQRPQKKSV